jgi:hypothetical protein
MQRFGIVKAEKDQQRQIKGGRKEERTRAVIKNQRRNSGNMEKSLYKRGKC